MSEQIALAEINEACNVAWLKFLRQHPKLHSLAATTAGSLIKQIFDNGFSRGAVFAQGHVVETLKKEMGKR